VIIDYLVEPPLAGGLLIDFGPRLRIAGMTILLMIPWAQVDYLVESPLL
jgi:hypothetical protein